MEVTVINDGYPLNDIGDTPVSWERTIVRQKDKFKKILGDAQARCSVTISERIGAANYSSVSMSTTVTLSCNQDSKTIQEAEEMALAEALAFTDDNIVTAYRMLEQHQQTLYDDGDS